DEGQLVSVSHIAFDPLSSPMVEQAARYEKNHGQAEQIFAMQPDLVLAGVYSDPYTIGLLRRLGVEVVQFPLEQDFDAIRANILKMGDVLGREDAARQMVAEFDADLAALGAVVAERPTALLHYANNYTSGDRSLAHHILSAAGFANATTEAGITVAGSVPLEKLVLLMPDLVISGQAYPGASRAEEVLDHPALEGLQQRHYGAALTDAEWVCGTPFVLRAVTRLVDIRKRM
ncbi:MAG: ABC transporter substrate-binding protein, partial [Rhodobacterales bacterium]|nr:ABC transporter substrate-binding protein [Rhodobacterales bacterium]MDX5412619.1 ABC transporter substrate-binding protein [Rhodobacterales bacterium]